jgi:CBS domain containing-hemolysin-like protein
MTSKKTSAQQKPLGAIIVTKIMQNSYKQELFYLSLFLIIISIVMLNVGVVSNPIFRGILYSIMALAIAYIFFWILVFAFFYWLIYQLPKR